MFRSLCGGALLGFVACLGVGAVTVSEYQDPGCTTLLPAGSQGPQSPFTVSSGQCVPFGAGSSVGYFQAVCDGPFFAINVFGSSSTSCTGPPAVTSTGTSNQCTQLALNSWVKVNCGGGSPSGNAVVRAFADTGCSVQVNVASSGNMGPATLPNGACSSLPVGSGNIWMTATVYGPLFSLSAWGSSGANCQGAPDAMTIMGAVGVCTPAGNQYVIVTPASGSWSGAGSSGSVTEYSDSACSVVAPAGSNGPSQFQFNNGQCTQYRAGSNVGYYQLSGACSMYVLSVYGSSSSNCNGVPAMIDVGVTGTCSSLTSTTNVSPPGYPPYHPVTSHAMVTFNANGNTCPNSANTHQQTGTMVLVLVLVSAVFTQLAL